MHSLAFAVSIAISSTSYHTHIWLGYYMSIPVFKTFSMKALSGPIGHLWESDLNKPLWSLMAKAWSNIRDQIGNDNAPLHQFFSIVCPHLNIPSPEFYLELLGWDFVVDDKGALTVSRNPYLTLDAANVGVSAAAVSVEDIVSHCQSVGYAQGYNPDQNPTSSTFLGHSPSYIQKVRSMEKKKRRAKSEALRGSRFAAEMKAKDEQAQRMVELTNEACQRDTAGDLNLLHHQYHTVLTQAMLVAQNIATNHLGNMATNTTPGTATGSQGIPTNASSHTANTPQDITADDTNSTANMDPSNAFRVGANTTSTLPAIGNGGNGYV
jgi:hypothetical protein